MAPSMPPRSLDSAKMSGVGTDGSAASGSPSPRIPSTPARGGEVRGGGGGACVSLRQGVKWVGGRGGRGERGRRERAYEGARERAIERERGQEGRECARSRACGGTRGVYVFGYGCGECENGRM